MMALFAACVFLCGVSIGVVIGLVLALGIGGSPDDPDYSGGL